MVEKGILITLSGPSGSGKGTIIKELLAERNDIVKSVSATTRAARPGEKDGVDYHFISRAQFETMAVNGEFLEYAAYSGHLYGTPMEPVGQMLESGKNVLLEIEVQGAEQVMDRLRREVSDVQMVSVFITIPSLAELERRLRGRATETEEKINTRLAVAKRELARAFRYDYIVLNDEVASAVAGIRAIITAEMMRYNRMAGRIRRILTDHTTGGNAYA